MKQAFQANSGLNTVRLAVTTTSGTTRVALPTASPSSVIRIFNAGSAIAYVAIGTSTGATATVPVAGGANGSMPVGSGITEIQVAGNTHVAAITSTGTADLYFTVGEGY